MIEKSLAGPIGLIVKVSTLQDYGVDKFFFLESKNASTSQRNVVFIARGECARNAQEIAGKFLRDLLVFAFARKAYSPVSSQTSNSYGIVIACMVILASHRGGHTLST